MFLWPKQLLNAPPTVTLRPVLHPASLPVSSRLQGNAMAPVRRGVCVTQDMCSALTSVSGTTPVVVSPMDCTMRCVIFPISVIAYNINSTHPSTVFLKCQLIFNNNVPYCVSPGRNSTLRIASRSASATPLMSPVRPPNVPQCSSVGCREECLAVTL